MMLETASAIPSSSSFNCVTSPKRANIKSQNISKISIASTKYWNDREKIIAQWVIELIIEKLNSHPLEWSIRRGF